MLWTDGDTGFNCKCMIDRGSVGRNEALEVVIYVQVLSSKLGIWLQIEHNCFNFPYLSHGQCAGFLTKIAKFSNRSV